MQKIGIPYILKTMDIMCIKAFGAGLHTCVPGVFQAPRVAAIGPGRQSCL